jgi:hypothetical protein
MEHRDGDADSRDRAPVALSTTRPRMRLVAVRGKSSWVEAGRGLLGAALGVAGADAHTM